MDEGEQVERASVEHEETYEEGCSDTGSELPICEDAHVFSDDYAAVNSRRARAVCMGRWWSGGSSRQAS